MKKVLKRFACLLMSLVMCAGMLPAITAAYDTEDEIALYEYMLALGMVDDNGDIIEDTHFELENGDMLSSVGELRAYIGSADDMQQSVRVWGLGANVTLEELAAALSIEDFMGDVSSRLLGQSLGAVETFALSQAPA